VINSDFQDVISLAQTTTVLETPPEDDPVQYVRQQFLILSGREPDAASHFYWADLLLRCGNDQNCRDATQTDLNEYLKKQPDPHFSLAGTVIDEAGNPMDGAVVNLTGSQLLTTLTDAAGNFHFSNLTTSGVYTVTASKPHYGFATNGQTFVNPAHDVSVSFHGRFNHFSIMGRITKEDGTAASGLKVQLLQSSSFVITNENGDYAFVDLIGGGTYTVLPTIENAVFSPANTTIVDLAADSNANFVMKPLRLLKIEASEHALVLDSVNFVTEPFSVFEQLGFSPDGIRRITLFAANLEGVSDLSKLSMIAEDSEGHTYPLEIEFVGDVPQQNWLKQLNVKLSPELSGKCVDLKLSVGGLTSDAAQLCLAND
jgi:hypothetical protein